MGKIVPLIFIEKSGGSKKITSLISRVVNYLKKNPIPLFIILIILMVLVIKLINKNISSNSNKTTVSLQKNVDSDGNITYSKIVNGEKQELTEEDIKKLNLTVQKASSIKEETLKIAEDIKEEALNNLQN